MSIGQCSIIPFDSTSLRGTNCSTTEGFEISMTSSSPCKTGKALAQEMTTVWDRIAQLLTLQDSRTTHQPRALICLFVNTFKAKIAVPHKVEADNEPLLAGDMISFQ